MAAIVYPIDERTGRPLLRLVPPHTRRLSRKVVYRRRRAVALAAAVVLVWLTSAVLSWLGSGPLAASEPAGRSVPMAPVAASVHVVQPGDSLWTIARALQPTGDVRPLVGRLAEARDRRPLVVGERVRLP